MRQAKRDAGVPVTQHPEKVERRDLRDGFGDKVRDDTIQAYLYVLESIITPQLLGKNLLFKK